jgi:hypothetical protein
MGREEEGGRVGVKVVQFLIASALSRVRVRVHAAPVHSCFVRVCDRVQFVRVTLAREGVGAFVPAAASRVLDPSLSDIVGLSEP